MYVKLVIQTMTTADREPIWTILNPFQHAILLCKRNNWFLYEALKWVKKAGALALCSAQNCPLASRKVIILEKLKYVGLPKLYLAGIYLCQMSNASTTAVCEICSKLTIKALDRLDVSDAVLVSLLLTLNRFVCYDVSIFEFKQVNTGNGLGYNFLNGFCQSY